MTLHPPIISGWYVVHADKEGRPFLGAFAAHTREKAKADAMEMRSKRYRVVGVACVVAEIEPLELEDAR